MEESSNAEIFEKIDFSKYLNCLACKETEFYCNKHKNEVEQIIQNASLTNKRHFD